MEVFISWSGPTSHSVAQALHGWLQDVLPDTRPWLSSADNGAGERWAALLGERLESANFGVLCLTPENLQAPWLLFEAGAIARALKGSRVVPFLFRVRKEDVTLPLSQFQAADATRDGARQLVESIHGANPNPLLAGDRVARSFERWWPDLESELRSIPAIPAPASHSTRRPEEILSEILDITRTLQRDLPGRLDAIAAAQSAGEAKQLLDDEVLLSDRQRIRDRLARSSARGRVPWESLRDRARSFIAQLPPGQRFGERNLAEVLGTDVSLAVAALVDLQREGAIEFSGIGDSGRGPEGTWASIVRPAVAGTEQGELGDQG